MYRFSTILIFLFLIKDISNHSQFANHCYIITANGYERFGAGNFCLNVNLFDKAGIWMSIYDYGTS